MAEARASAVLLLAVALLCARPSSAIDWRLSKGFGASAAHSDNADTSDGEARGESVLAFGPFVRVDGYGRRTDLSLGARFEFRRFVEEERDEFSPQLSFASRTELVRRFAELSTAARVSQRTTGTDPLVGEQLTRFEDTEEVYEFALAPSISDTLGDRASYQASYRFAAARGSGDDIVGSDVQAVSARMLGLATSELILIGAGEYELARFEGGEEARSAQIGAGVGYRFRPKLLGFAASGFDRIDTGGEEGVVDGTFWSVGTRWQPTERLTAKAAYAEREFGRSPSASLMLTGRRSTLELAWARELAFASGTALTDDLFSPEGPQNGGGPGSGGAEGVEDGEGSTDDSGPGVGVADGVLPATADGGIGDGGQLAPLGRELGSIDETVNVRYVLNGRVSTLSASLGWARRERLDSDLVTDGLEYGLDFRRTLSRRVQGALGLTTIENGYSDERRRTRENRVRLSIRVTL